VCRASFTSSSSAVAAFDTARWRFFNTASRLALEQGMQVFRKPLLVGVKFVAFSAFIEAQPLQNHVALEEVLSTDCSMISRGN
jgi:hypothetical protein